MGDRETEYLGGAQPFPATSWSLVSLCKDPLSSSYRAGLQTLYRKYWGPVYFYIRRNWGRDVEEAKDLTQEFFLALIEKDFLRSVESGKGRFRSFVCVALKHFLGKHRRAAQAKKRAPESGALISLEEIRPGEIPAAQEADRDGQFDADWKRAAIDAVLRDLRTAAAREGKGVFAELFIRYDIERIPEEHLTYEDLAKAGGRTVEEVTSGLRWARTTFKRCFVREIRDQVSSAEDLREEAWELFRIKVE